MTISLDSNVNTVQSFVYTLKEFTDYYKQRGTTIFVTFLDASKAFDKSNFWLLFQKLITKDFPVFIIKILAYWYCHQEMHVRWGSTITSSFHVSYMVLSRVVFYSQCFFLMFIWTS